VVCVRHGGHPWAGAESSRELLGRFLDDLQLPSRRLGLYFATPTAIQPRSPREPASGLFPEPGIIFPNLASKWVKLAPELSAERASLVMAAATHAGATLKVSRYKLQTQPHYLRASKPAAKRGYVGAIEFVAPSGADEKLLRALHFLCAYAFYAGIGAHTAMGMGQARPLTPQPLR
jgi:CRISPR-associated endoribonuclease Cas6